MNPTGKRLSVLLKGAGLKRLKAGEDPLVKRIAIDSRRVMPGSVFFALPGFKSDGNSYVSEAVSRGAVAVVSDRPRRLGAAKVAYVTAGDPRAALAKVARTFYDFPDRELRLAGVTGTNGKTTVTNVTRHLLAGEGRKVGCLGTIGYDLGGRVLPSFRTTPEAHELCELLWQMKDNGCEEAVMEVSSIGIDQQRVNELEFEVACFLNLTRDHLDYHGDMEAYFEVKRRLFTGELGSRPRVAVVNIDDPYGQRLAKELAEAGEGAITFSAEGEAEVWASEVELLPRQTRFLLHWGDGEARIETSLIGHYNVSNLLAAFAICRGMGRDPGSLVGRLESFKGIPGRMEQVENERGFQVIVDYAHTADALRNALTMLREITVGRLLLVFGCGGNRDRGKRVDMMEVAQKRADRCWATADNPRGEPLEQIFDDMRKGVSRPESVEFVTDRRRAIELALREARPGDCVLIAGKGHETFQEFGETVMSFDDRKVARELLEVMNLGGVS